MSQPPLSSSDYVPGRRPYRWEPVVSAGGPAQGDPGQGTEGPARAALLPPHGQPGCARQLREADLPDPGLRQP